MTSPGPVGGDAPVASGDVVAEGVRRAYAGETPLGAGIVRALRSGVVRRQGQGHVAGVCAALAEAGGLPPRLVQLLAVGLVLLGVGAPAYVVTALLLPRERPAGPGGPDGDAVIDTPLRALLSRNPGRGDILLAVLLGPALIVGGYWAALFVVGGLAPLRPLAPLVLVGLLVAGWGALRARRARQAFIVASLAHRAGILDDGELARTVESLRREAPRAWGTAPAAGGAATDAAGSGPVGSGPIGAGTVGAAPAGAPPVGLGAAARAPRAPRLAARAGWALAGAIVALGTLAFIAVSLRPGLAPGLSSGGPLPVIGSLGAAAAVGTLASGLVLVVLGVVRRRSVAVSVLGVLALLVFAGSVAWVRTTWDPHAAPLETAFPRYAPGTVDVCTDDAPGSLSRETVIDLRALGADAPTDAQALDLLRAVNPGVADTDLDLTMYLVCDRPVGDVRVLLPPEGPGIAVASGMRPTFGTVSGDVPPVADPWAPGQRLVSLQGSVIAGDIVFEREPAPTGSGS
ncbi:PspC domain-containing protein [Brachybacterium huguangmaarense]